MNKQEAIEKIKSKKISNNCLSNYGLGYNEALDEVIYIINQLDEPEKPVVPQYVADMIIEKKKKYGIVDVIKNLGVFNNPFDLVVEKQLNWIVENQEDFVKAWLYGYEIEKDKLYTVELPNPNGDSNRYGLCKVDGRIIIGSFVFGLNKAINTKLTEAEIKEDFEWAWRFAKEVEE